MFADLHTHTSASDGKLTPIQLINLAKNKGLAGIGITDHDTTDGVEEAIRAGRNLEITVVPGIELSTELQQTEIHILGYFIDYQDEYLQSKLKELRSERVTRSKKIVKRLNDLGFKLDWDEFMASAGQGSIGRPHIALALIKKGYIRTMEEGFQKLLNRGAPAFVPREKLSPREGIELIKKAKGVAVLAHPGLLEDSRLVNEVIASGLHGIEVYYPLHSAEDIDLFQALCDKHQLIATGGSDFHGIGSESKAKIGSAVVPYRTIASLERLKGGEKIGEG